MDFGHAVGVAFGVGSARKLKEGEVDETEEIGWTYGLIGVAILVVTQVGLLFWSTSGGLDGEVVRDLSIVAFAALVVPFILFWITAMITGTMNRLPASFLYLGIMLAVIQVVSAVLSSFGTSQSGFLLGLLLAVSMLGAKGFFKLGWVPAIVIGVLVVAGFVGAGILLFALPAGRFLR
jgi:hypothetical protein